MKIPVGNFGNAVPQPGPDIAVPQQAFGDSRGIIKAGQALGEVRHVVEAEMGGGIAPRRMRSASTCAPVIGSRGVLAGHL